MNDKTIINTILKIHFIIISALSFIFLTLSLLFILLQSGIYIKTISLPNIEIEKLYIKWNEKLSLSIEELKIINNSEDSDIKLSANTVNNLLKTILLFDNWFESFEVKKIIFNDINASFLYREGSDGYLVASSKDFSLKSSLYYETNYLNATIKELLHFKKKIGIDGNLIFDGEKRELISNLNIDINSDISLKAYSVANRDRVAYKIDSKKKIESLKHTMQMIDLPKEVRYWAYDAIRFNKLDIESISGWFEYEKIDLAYKNIKVKASASDLSYAYHKDLEPVVTQRTDLEFRDGVLYIRPKESYQYGFDLQESWLKIDFSKKEELLSLFLTFDGKVNRDLLYLLKLYDIELPIFQNSGSVATDLKITVGLREIEVDAKGVFYAKKANFNYLGLDIDLSQTKVYLDNYDIRIPKMQARYKDIAEAQVDVVYDAKESTGKIDFEFQKIDLNGFELKERPLRATYNISKTQDTIDIDRSKWSYREYIVNLDSLKVLFDLDSLVAKILTAHIDIEELSTIFASGELSLDPLKADFDIDLLSFNMDHIKMNQSSTSIKLKYDKKITLKLNEETRLIANNLDYRVKNTLIAIDQDEFNILSLDAKIEDLADTKLSASYLFDKNIGSVEIEELHFQNSELGEIFNSDEIVKLNLAHRDEKLVVDIDKLDAKFTIQESGWRFKFDSLERLSKRSTLLQDNNITDGDFLIYKDKKEQHIAFLANINYPYKILTYENRPIENYILRGYIDEDREELSININNSVDVKVGEDINIWANSIGINIDALLNFINDKERGVEEDSKSDSKKNIIFDSKDCYFYVDENRHIISQTMQLQYFNKVLNAQLKHRSGSAGFELKDDKFYLYGGGFGDDFMEKLFYLSDFKGGVLSFSMQGSPDDYKGLVQIKDTTIVDYKILNNILAFVNTIPSLVTFSLPGYSKNGLEVESAYASFHAKDDILNFSDISLNSKEMVIAGYGSASYLHNTIDLTLSLKTDLGSSVSKIPVVGHIILGEDTISTTMKVSGELSDPKVSSLIAKDIIVAPINIIKRTLMFPFTIFQSDDEE